MNRKSSNNHKHSPKKNAPGTAGKKIGIHADEGRPVPIKNLDSGKPAVLVPVSAVKAQERLTRKLTARMHQQEVIALLSQIALASVDLDLSEFMDEVSVFLARTLDVEYAKILELDHGGQFLTLRAGYGWKKGMVPNVTKFESKSSVAGLTLLSKQPIVIKDLREERDLQGLPHLKFHHVISGMSVIIHAVESPYGVLGVYSTALKAFTADDLNFLQSVANILALCFERQKAESERLKVENELRRFQYMADNANIGISLIDASGKFKYVNRVTYERLGLTKEEYMQRRVLNSPPDAKDASDSRFDELFKKVQKKQVAPVETIEMKKDRKEHIPLEINLTGVKFEGDPYMFAVSQDITERVKAQKERVKTEQSLAFLAEASLILSSSLDYAETLNSVAKIAISYVADWCSVDMLNDKGELDLVALQHNDPKKVEFAWKYRNKNKPDMNQPTGTPNVVRTGKPELYSDINEEMLMAAAQDAESLKAIRYIGLKSAMTVPIKLGKKTLGAITFIVSQGDRRYDKDDLAIAQELATRAALAIENSKLYTTIEEQKRRLDNIITNVPGIVWENWLTQNPEEQKTNFISNYVESMLGYSGPEWKKSGFMRSIIHPEDIEKTYAEYSQMIAEKRGLVQRFRLRKKNGSYIWAESHSSIIFDAAGAVIGLRGVIMDVSQRMEFEQRKDEFISMASHELKTPVTTLKVFTQILHKQSEKAGDVNMALYLSKMDAQITRLTDLINDLLDLSKIQTGKLSFKLSKFSLDDLVREIVEQIQPTDETHEIVVQGSFKSKIEGDRDRLGQVLINLITNALKYSPKADKVNIILSEEGGNLLVGVQDFGIGIASEQQDKIFERFYQVTDGDQKTYPGLGIGLYISDQIMRRHGGKINVSSAKGKWSLFQMVLPVKQSKKGVLAS